MTNALTAWLAVTSATATFGGYLDIWLDEKVRKHLSDVLTSRLRRTPAEWFHSVEVAFSALFDYVYGWRKSKLNRIIWRAILFSYLMLMMARLVLWAFRMRVPQMEKILVIAFVVAIGVTTLLQIDIPALHLKEAPAGPPLKQLIRERRFVSTVILSALFVAYYTFAAIFTGHGVGISFKTVSAIAFGAAIGVPAVVLVSRIRDDIVPVGPLRAIISSIAFIGLLAILFRSAASSFVSELQSRGPLIFATIAFNLFGDAVSLVETRWLLRLSRGLPMIGIVGMLILDLILSAFFYLVLPGIAGIHWSILFLAAKFGGPHPWMGILFWSTFFTSLLFYLFVASMLLIRMMLPLMKLLNRLDRWFSLYDHPMRLITIAMIGVESTAFRHNHKPGLDVLVLLHPRSNSQSHGQVQTQKAGLVLRVLREQAVSPGESSSP